MESNHDDLVLADPILADLAIGPIFANLDITADILYLVSLILLILLILLVLLLMILLTTDC